MSGSILEILDEIKEVLSQSPYLSESRIISGFSSTLKDVPLRRSMIAVSIGSFELTEGTLGRYYGKNGDGREIFGRNGKLAIHLDIAVPKLLGGEVCNEIFNALASAVLSSSFGVQVLSLKADQIRADQNLGALVIPAVLTVNAIIMEDSCEYEGELFQKIVVK